MPNNQDILHRLISHHGSMKALGLALHEISGGTLSPEPPTEFRIHNWKDRGVPPGWRYWIVQIAKRCGMEVDEAAVMRGDVAA